MSQHSLYQEMILDHSKRPRNFRALAEANRKADGFNRLCGDKVTVFVRLEGDVIRDLSFQGSGCAISTASASLLTEVLKGKTQAEAERIFHKFHDLVTGKSHPEAEEMGKLAVFSGVSEYPARVKCASLAWHTLQAALHQEPAATGTAAPQPVSTE